MSEDNSYTENQESDVDDKSLKKERRDSDRHDDYFNSKFSERPVYLEPGQIIFSDKNDEMLIAVVGSGVVVSIYDQHLKIGVLGYVLLPDEILAAFPHFEEVDQSLMDNAFKPINECIHEMKRNGAGKNRILIRLMGGSNIPSDEMDAGTKNYVFVHEYLVGKGLKISNQDLGGSYVRRVHFFPTRGHVVRSLLRRDSDFKTVELLENEYLKEFPSKES
ncbi:MAG: chemotaxis protein CheD [Alphaproteobacteria bacterium]|nr:chemotaxis protein CheD [Alphaproteobacteria bacterium]